MLLVYLFSVIVTNVLIDERRDLFPAAPTQGTELIPCFLCWIYFS